MRLGAEAKRAWQTRVDAYKLAVQSRRIRSQTASGIGLYSKIMNLLCFTAIVINASLLGLTSRHAPDPAPPSVPLLLPP
jgi:hypothetical protein